ncbi:DUF1638 domain-containing protein [Desulfuromonas thiophila]|uniref:DUF1638 domain-containing protein n=1 Tax=Desulfuromonas thiophila TaxID=57664 RepID=UPI0029F4A4B6|nr:DUF1638 domain-containing protein [Desulfuromonas thiophila]
MSRLLISAATPESEPQGDGVRLGVIACSALRLELENLLADVPEVSRVIFLDATLHNEPQNMRQRLETEIRALASEVDAIFLGYGFCRSLRDLEQAFGLPVILPQFDDCISLLLSPERYNEEIRREAGTWFIPPGYAMISAKMVIESLKLDRIVRYGKDPMAMARRLFSHYRRGLFIDTGAGERETLLAAARQFCDDFNLSLETTTGDTRRLELWLAKARVAAAQAAKRRCAAASSSCHSDGAI